MANVKHSRIKDSLWILFSLILYLTGIGFIYIGCKTSNKNWVKEGIIYEIPWIIYFLVSSFNETLVNIMVVVVLLFMAIAFIRSVVVVSRYHEILDAQYYKKSIDKKVSFIFIAVSGIIFINGFGLFYLGDKTSNKKLKVEGLFYEFLWFLALITVFLKSNFFVGLALAFTLISLMRAIIINYENDNLYEQNSYSSSSSKSNNQSFGFQTSDNMNDISNSNDSSGNDLNGADFNNNINETNTKNTDMNGADNFNDVKSFESYKSQIYDLKNSFDFKEKKVSDIIERRFSSSKITYDKFMTVISEAHDNFYNHVNSSLEIIDFADKPNEKFEKEILKRIDVLKSILNKMDDLSIELLLNEKEEEQANDDLKNLVEDMENLIDSIKDYK